jgi:AcrR family transcriptional regulator
MNGAPLSVPARSRGRPRQFKVAAASVKLRLCFAQRGYSGTSLEHLTQATGLSKPSLYSAFGDKRSMFLGALDEEYAELKTRLGSLKRAGGVPQRLQEFLHAVAKGYSSTAGEGVSGIAFAAALADTERDPEIKGRLRTFHLAVEEAAQRSFGKDFMPFATDMLAAFAISLCACARFREAPLKDVDPWALAALLACRR